MPCSCPKGDALPEDGRDMGVRRCSWGLGHTLGRCKARQDPNPQARPDVLRAAGTGTIGEPGLTSCRAKGRA